MKRALSISLFSAAATVAIFLTTSVRALEPVAVEPTIADGFAWYDGTQMPVENKCWNDVNRYFARLPGRSEGVVSNGVWSNSQFSAGEVLRFKTNADRIDISYRLFTAELAHPHLPATGCSGFDLYAFDEEKGAWRWAACTQPTKQEDKTVWISGMERKEREFMVYLPLYNGVDALSIGVPEDCDFTVLAPRPEKPIVYYGSSIAHGGCASRPGNAYTAMIGRRLDIPVVNLGFSGSAVMEIEIAELLSEVDAEIYVLDPLPNMYPGMVAERAVPFIKKLRETRPDVPILLVEDRYHSFAWMRPGIMSWHQGNHAELRKAFDALKPNDPNLYYLDAENLIGDKIDNDSTMDGSHLNDLGMYRQADALEAVLRPILEKARAGESK